MPGEEYSEVEDHADHRRDYARERSGELEIAVRGFDQRPADQGRRN
jgi:hypothetical protein